MQGKPSSSTRRLGALSSAQQRITAAFRLTALIPRQGWRSFRPREGRWRDKGKPGSAARAPPSPNGPQTLRHRRTARRGGAQLLSRQRCPPRARRQSQAAALVACSGQPRGRPARSPPLPGPGARGSRLRPPCPGAGSGSRRGRGGWRAMPGGPAAGAGLARGGSNLTEEGLGRPLC